MGTSFDSLDISAAFLQGNAMTRDVYVRPPNDVCISGKVWKLHRCLYGLNDAPRAWYKRVVEEFCKLNAKMSLYDEAMFIWIAEGVLVFILVTHVDDFIYCGTDYWVDKIIGHIRTTFKIICELHSAFKYTGLKVTQTEKGIIIDQNSYVAGLELLSLPPTDCLKKM